MKLEKTMLIEASNGFEYVVMSVLEEDGKEYAFANKLVDEDPTMEYSIFTIENARLLHKNTHEIHDLLHDVKQISHSNHIENMQKGIISNKPAPVRELLFLINIFVCTAF